MNPKLQPVLDRFERATPEVQDRIVHIITTTIDEAGHDEYAAYVDRELAKGQADIDAGRGRPLNEAFADVQAKMKAKYGAV